MMYFRDNFLTPLIDIGFFSGAAFCVGYSAPIALCYGIGAAIFLNNLTPMLNAVKKMRDGGEALKPAVFFMAEHLSQFTPGACSSQRIMPPVLACVEKMESPRSQQLKGCLKDMLHYENNFDASGKSNCELNEFYKNKANHLAPGEIMALPISIPNETGAHFLIVSIEKKESTFSVTVHNGGDGCNYHFFSNVSPKETLYHSALQIDAVSLPNLLKFIEDVGSLQVRSSSIVQPRIDQFYIRVFPALNGIFVPPNHNSHLWTSGQTGGSCSGFSLKCFIKWILSRDEYIEFSTRFDALMANKLTDGIRSHYRYWEQTPLHHVVLKMLKLKLFSMPRKFIDEEVFSALAKQEKASFLGKWVGYFMHGKNIHASSEHIEINMKEGPHIGKALYSSIPAMNYCIKAHRLIEKNKIQEAREEILKAYDAARQQSVLNPEESTEVSAVYDDFCQLAATFYPQNAQELECFAGIELVFDMFCSRMTWVSWPKLRFLNRLFQWHFEYVIKDSPWEFDMWDAYQVCCERMDKDSKGASMRIPDYIQVYAKS